MRRKMLIDDKYRDCQPRATSARTPLTTPGYPEYNLIELPDDLEFPKEATGAIYWEVEHLVRT